ncbi:MAG: hypothetical protein AB7O66_02325 [Limisphaerales bacterium]
MKTSIDLPEDLVYRARVAAAKRRTTLKNLVVEGLEAVLSPGFPRKTPAPAAIADADFEADVYGVPVLKRRDVVVTDRMIEALREEQGV